MTKNNNYAIGVFDSGLGGLTVVKEIKRLLPYENIIYLGDTARVPYGTRSKETILKFSIEDVEFLLKKKIKCIVVACNTSSANALHELKNIFNIPLFGVIYPGANKAVRLTKNNKIGVIGTRGTILSEAYKKAIHKKDKKVKVYEKITSLFVPFIEEGNIEGELLELLVKKSVANLKNKKIDILILGCTHFPIIEKAISKEFPNVKLVNPGIEAAKELKNFIVKNDMQNKKNKNGDISYYVTDLTSRFVEVASMFLGEKINGKIFKVDI